MTMKIEAIALTLFVLGAACSGDDDSTVGQGFQHLTGHFYGVFFGHISELSRPLTHNRQIWLKIYGPFLVMATECSK